mmetsp:Transcript_67793/g.161793  ORF Transcript_67793/g.161793 Transcript_67793/m.161793 type:complete len:320 (-) Transcript_67793:523-1482(-)
MPGSGGRARGVVQSPEEDERAGPAQDVRRADRPPGGDPAAPHPLHDRAPGPSGHAGRGEREIHPLALQAGGGGAVPSRAGYLGEVQKPGGLGGPRADAHRAEAEGLGPGCGAGGLCPGEAARLHRPAPSLHADPRPRAETGLRPVAADGGAAEEPAETSPGADQGAEGRRPGGRYPAGRCKARSADCGEGEEGGSRLVSSAAGAAGATQVHAAERAPHRRLGARAGGAGCLRGAAQARPPLGSGQPSSCVQLPGAIAEAPVLRLPRDLSTSHAPGKAQRPPGVGQERPGDRGAEPGLRDRHPHLRQPQRLRHREVLRLS